MCCHHRCRCAHCKRTHKANHSKHVMFIYYTYIFYRMHLRLTIATAAAHTSNRYIPYYIIIINDILISTIYIRTYNVHTYNHATLSCPFILGECVSYGQKFLCLFSSKQFLFRVYHPRANSCSMINLFGCAAAVVAAVAAAACCLLLIVAALWRADMILTHVKFAIATDCS